MRNTNDATTWFFVSYVVIVGVLMANLFIGIHLALAPTLTLTLTLTLTPWPRTTGEGGRGAAAEEHFA